ADRVERVHLRDAVPGNLNVGIGRGNVDFAGVIGVLEKRGFSGTYVLELETHDVEEADREADARRSLELVIGVLEGSR
ncbi:MAG: sugar phosphate isomerase/epimerase, partial [Actinomycetes bacterium]